MTGMILPAQSARLLAGSQGERHQE